MMVEASSNNNDGNESDQNNIIDHNHLKPLANFYYETQYGLGGVHNRQCGIAGSEEELHAEARQEGQRMVSFMDLEEYSERYVGTGINLSWGEYYVPHNSDDDESEEDDKSSCDDEEEAEEIEEDQCSRENEEVFSQAQAIAATRNTIFNSRFDGDQLENGIAQSTPSLMGMPDTILETILHFSIDNPSDVCVLERVCKRICRMTTSNDKFWARRAKSFEAQTGLIETRTEALEIDGVKRIRHYQRNLKGTNTIIDVLREDKTEECVADTLRTLSANVLSRMNHLGLVAQFRLRGDILVIFLSFYRAT